MYIKVICFIIFTGGFVVFSDGLKPKDRGVCLSRISTYKTKFVTYRVTINKMCGKKKCTVLRRKTQSYIQTTNNPICCKGFMYMHKTDKCSPVCSAGCVGGRCTAPDTCVCDPPSILRNNTCTKPCDPPCFNAVCGNDNTCSCSANFTSFNATHCYKCDPGFIINDNFTCVPKCDGCANGICSAPNNCTCLDGYERFNESNCIPKCDNCSNGVCVAPNVCECNEGYKNIMGVCEPVCEVICVNGHCSAPNVCTCDEGFVNNGTNQTCSVQCPEGFNNASAIVIDNSKMPSIILTASLPMQISLLCPLAISLTIAFLRM